MVLVAVGGCKSEEAMAVEAMISSIGEVTLNSEEIFDKAEQSYAY